MTRRTYWRYTSPGATHQFSKTFRDLAFSNFVFYHHQILCWHYCKIQNFQVWLLYKCSEKSSLRWSKSQPHRIRPVNQLDHRRVSVRPVVSDSTECVQSILLTSPIWGWKTLTGACSSRVFRTMVIFLKLHTKRSQNCTETGTCPTEKTLSSYEREGGKRIWGGVKCSD